MVLSVQAKGIVKKTVSGTRKEAEQHLLNQICEPLKTCRKRSYVDKTAGLSALGGQL